MDFALALAGLLVAVVFAFKGERYVVQRPTANIFSALIILAPIAGWLIFIAGGSGAGIWAGLTISFHVLLLRVLYRAFERRLGRVPHSTVYLPRQSGDGPDRLFSALFTVTAAISYVGIGVLTKLLAGR